jgi:hypothetical protein
MLACLRDKKLYMSFSVSFFFQKKYDFMLRRLIDEKLCF